MSWVRRIVLVGGLSAVLGGCDSDASDARAVAQREAALVRALAKSGETVESIRLVLTRRGYTCADQSGLFAVEGGSTASASRFVHCAKKVAGTIVCAYRIQVILVPRDASPEIHVHNGEVCL
jgi:hypothetical protein